jgi:hypothetical protein
MQWQRRGVTLGKEIHIKVLGSKKVHVDAKGKQRYLEIYTFVWN